MSGHNNYYGLFEAFIDGATDDEHNKIEIVERNGNTLLVGYKHAVYAKRSKGSDAITIFTGWGERSTKTSEIHMAKIQKAMDRFRDWSDGLSKDSTEDRLPTLHNGDLESFSVDVTADGDDEDDDGGLADLFADDEPSTDDVTERNEDGLGELFVTGDD